MVGSFRVPSSSSSASTTYTRPADWLTIPTVTAGQQKVVLLHAVFNHDSNFCAVNCASNYTVDWGDGVVENFSANVQANHIFDYNYSGFIGTETTAGYRQAIVSITPQAGFNFTKVDLTVKHNQSGLQAYSSAWLDINMAGSLISTLTLFGTITARYLERFNYVGTNAITSGSELFRNLNSLRIIVSFSTDNITNMASMFNGCSFLLNIPLFNTVNVTNMVNMFVGCSRLTTIPLLNTINVTSMSAMFQSCGIQTVPLLNTSKVQNMSTMFNGAAVTTIPIFDTALVNNMQSMFASSALKVMPLINTVGVSNMANMFQGCYQLETVPVLNTANVNNMNAMFQSCTILKKIPLLNTINVVNNMNGFVGSCPLLQELPALNFLNVASLTSAFSSSLSISKIPILNIKSSIDLTSLRLSRLSILEVFGNLQTAVQTITITGNYGADTPISKTLCGTVAGSTVVTQLNTSSLAVGMIVLGTGINTAQAVTFQDSGDTVTLNAHGLVNGNIVAFPTIVTTTGIVINKPYFVVGATTNTFQVSLTLGGAAIALTNNGTGTVNYGSFIQSISTNVSFTLDKPASATGTVTLTARLLDTSVATLKGWTVVG